MRARGTPCVIIADNNEFWRRVLSDFYRERGFEVRACTDGLRALEQIEDRPPDLLLLDLIMPSIDGAQLCRWVKSRESYRHIPVIIFSGILSDEIGDLEGIGADAYVAKMPLDQIAGALEDATQALMEGHREGPMHYGFEKMFRREVVLELIHERHARSEVLDSLVEGIVELSPQRRILRSNRAFEQITGRGASDLLSRRLEEILPGVGKGPEGLFGARIEASGSSYATFVHNEIHLHVTAHKIRHDPARRSATDHLLRRAALENEKVALHGMLDAITYILLVEDITDRMRAEKEREDLKSRLQQSERMSSLGVFVSGAAHELNNPLTSILGYSQLVIRKSAEHRRELDKIAEGAQRCKEIVEQLMAFARSLRPDRRVTDLNALLRDGLESHAARIASDDIRIETDFGGDPDGSARARVDAAQIGQVFHHVLDNAIKALRDALGARTLRVSTRREGQRFVVEVADNGPGIPESRLDRIFDPVFTSGIEGTGRGLGLSVAYGIITAHGGRIRAGNRSEGGALIHVEIPATEEQAMTRETTKPAAEPREGSQRRILVVDDEKVVAELIVEILTARQHEVDTAHNGMDALRLIRHRKYDLVILDLRMPDMSGQQLYEHLAREHPEILDRLLFITGDTVMPEIHDFLEQAGKPCLMKPFALEDLIGKTQSILFPS